MALGQPGTPWWLGRRTIHGHRLPGLFLYPLPPLPRLLPNDGVDILNEKLYWAMPDGRVVCWSAVELSQKHPDELYVDDVYEAYLAISKECGYDPLGKPVCDNEFEQFRQDVGVLEELR